MTVVTQRNKEEVEEALFHLMYQFRQINQKYGLMVKEEIKTLYQERNDCIIDSQEKVKNLEHWM